LSVVSAKVLSTRPGSSLRQGKRVTRVQVVQGGTWDAEVIENDLGVPPLTYLRPVLSPVLFVEGDEGLEEARVLPFQPVG
jgi:hypothetical protein